MDTVDLPDTDKRKEFNDIRNCIKDYLLNNRNDLQSSKVESQPLDVTVPWNGSTKNDKLAFHIDQNYEYVSHKILEKSKVGNSSYKDLGLVGNEVIVDYEVSPQGGIVDQKRSWLELELQVTLRAKQTDQPDRNIRSIY